MEYLNNYNCTVLFRMSALVMWAGLSEALWFTQGKMRKPSQCEAVSTVSKVMFTRCVSSGEDGYIYASIFHVYVSHPGTCHPFIGNTFVVSAKLSSLYFIMQLSLCKDFRSKTNITKRKSAGKW